MEVHRVTLVVIDFDGLGADEVKHTLEDSHYPNRCIMPAVQKVETRDCGEWHDNHLLNSSITQEAELKRLFDNES